MFTPKYDHHGSTTGWVNLDRTDYLAFRDLNSGRVAVEAVQVGAAGALGIIAIADDRADAAEMVGDMLRGSTLRDARDRHDREEGKR